MEILKVAEYMEEKKGYLFPNKCYTDEEVEKALLDAPNSFENSLKGIYFKNPNTAKTLSIFLGLFGVNKFYMGNIVAGIFKYLTLVVACMVLIAGGFIPGIVKLILFAGILIWWLIDILTIKNKCLNRNCKKLMDAIKQHSNTSASKPGESDDFDLDFIINK